MGFGDGRHYVGTCVDDGRKCLLLSSQVVERVKRALEEAFGVSLPDAATFPARILGLKYAGVTGVEFRDEKDYYTTIKRISKEKHVEKQNAELGAARDILARAQQLVVSDPRHCWAFVSVDFEWHEWDSEKVLEIGWSIWDTYTKTVQSFHWIVEEHYHVHNGRFVPDRKHGFRFGDSQVGPLAHGCEALEYHLASGGPFCEDAVAGKAVEDVSVALIGHDLRGDLGQMQKLGIHLSDSVKEQFDTKKMHWGKVGGIGQARDAANLSLKKLVQHYGLSDAGLHNAGNDARYTLEAFLAISGLPTSSEVAPNTVDRRPRDNRVRYDSSAAAAAWSAMRPTGTEDKSHGW